jgi:tRNA pseudouridine55 synthase
MPDGWLLIDKPSGPTSHDVVREARRGLGERRVGHTGTLDPLASGVLLLAIGNATRLVEYLLGKPKRYRATIRLGASTDTYDAHGKVVDRSGGPMVERAQFERSLHGFIGRIRQVPPPFSAVRVQGERAYRLARRGQPVVLPPREVEISRLEMIAWNPPDTILEIQCSAGTYIRSLAHDLGQALGCGAHLTGLVRTAVGSYRLEEAVSMSALRSDADPETRLGHLRPIDEPIADWPRWDLTEEELERIRRGLDLAPPMGREDSEKIPLLRTHAPDGSFCAVLSWNPERSRYHPRKVFINRPDGRRGARHASGSKTASSGC